ncbi:MAG: hypothetical protein JRJ76_03540 [Deltaproteobacteria bacterium]|nr:hypothetical protein [Deltaproteobacteria bacterium]
MEKNLSKKYIRYGVIAGVIIIAIIISYALLVIYLSYWPFPVHSLNNVGVFGNSFGVISALFTGLAFAGLIFTKTYKNNNKLDRNRTVYKGIY